jgi:hypothetical protein
MAAVSAAMMAPTIIRIFDSLLMAVLSLRACESDLLD